METVKDNLWKTKQKQKSFKNNFHSLIEFTSKFDTKSEYDLNRGNVYLSEN
jgi:hypothetical protein